MEFRASENLAEQIAQYIGNKIILLELKPGERIIEARLAEELGVSRGPVREALRILEKHRLVELKPRREARVTEISEEFIINMYDIMKELYGLIARKYVENCTEEDVRESEASLRKVEDCAERGELSGYFDVMFEYALGTLKVAGNPLLEQILIDLWPSARRVQYASLSFRIDELKENVKFFQNAYKYLLKKNTEMVVQTFRDYIENEKKFALRSRELYS